MARNMIATERLPGGEMRLEMRVTVSMEIFQEIMAAVAKENPPVRQSNYTGASFDELVEVFDSLDDVEVT
jgi:hypothetical protein